MVPQRMLAVFAEAFRVYPVVNMQWDVARELACKSVHYSALLKASAMIC